MRTSIQKNAEKISISLLFKLLVRSLLFLFLFLTVLILLYIIGNLQLFLDSNQKIILSIASVCALFLFFLSIIAIIIGVLCLFIKKRKRLYYAVHLFLILFCTAYSITFFFLFRITLIFSSGLS